MYNLIWEGEVIDTVDTRTRRRILRRNTSSHMAAGRSPLRRLISRTTVSLPCMRNIRTSGAGTMLSKPAHTRRIGKGALGGAADAVRLVTT